jgi:hypothetical protein
LDRLVFGHDRHRIRCVILNEAALIAAYATLSVLIFSQGCGGPQKLWFQSRTSDNIHAAPVAFAFRNGVGDVISQS